MTKSFDRSHKDKKYFIDGTIFNCPFCKRRQVKYKVTGSGSYNNSNTSTTYYYLINCEDCGCVSFHLSKYELKKSKDILGKENFVYPPEKLEQKFVKDRDVSTLKIVEKKLLDENGSPKELDEVFFYSQPSSFFTIDERIPSEIREPLNEADVSLKNNLLTGASGALRKAIYKLLKIEKIPEINSQNKFISQDERVDQLKDKYPKIDSELFNELKAVHMLTSQELHENDWEDFDSHTLRFLIEVTSEILTEMYVLPDESQKRRKEISELKNKAKPKKISKDN